MMEPDFWDAKSCYIAKAGAEADASLENWLQQRGVESHCFFQTSGSEGLPKWVALSKGALLSSAAAVNAHFQVSAADHWLICLPLHHVGGFSITARVFLAGSRLSFYPQGKWQPQGFHQLCVEKAISLTSLVPTQVHDLVQQRLRAPGSLRAVIVGGGGMSQTLSDRAWQLGWRVYQSYGMTEAASQVATQAYADAPGAVDDLCVLPHWQVQQLEGTLALTGPALATAYVLETMPGRWEWQPILPPFCTRDQVELWQPSSPTEVAAGTQHLRFIGRQAGYIKRLGELIHLAPLQQQLENLALEHGITDIPIITRIPDPRADSLLILVTENAAAAATLLPRFNAQVSRLHQLSHSRQLTHIPRTALGKVDYLKLQQLLLEPSERHD
jgi:o-succinylbenzoate---CoA ligase